MHDWDDYRFFLAVADVGSVSAAATRLDTTQPTVGRRISALEKRLGAPLFLRSPTGYRLTPLGEKIRDRVRTIELETRWIEERLHHERNDSSGRVTLTAPEMLTNYLLVPLAERFSEKHPETQLDIMVSIKALDLLSGKADVALRVGDAGSGEYVGRQLAKIEFGLYVGKTYLQRAGPIRQLTDLRDHRIISSVRHIERLPQNLRLRELASGAEVTFSTDSIVTQLLAAQRGLGVVALPVYAAQTFSTLERVLPDDFCVESDLWLLTHRDLKATPRVRKVMDFLAEQVNPLLCQDGTRQGVDQTL